MGRPSLSATSRLFEDEVGHAGFEIPVNHGERSQIEGGVGDYQHEDATREGENRSEYEPDDQRLFDARKLAAFLVFTAFGCMWIVVGHFTGRQIGAFWTTYFMLPYILVGLWVGWALVAIGSTVMTLTLIGYFFSGGWFDLWMALVNGIGLVIGGFWMRRS